MKLKQPTLFIYDVEQFVNFHSLVAYNVITKEKHVFAVCDLRDDRIRYLKFLEEHQNSIWCGFNNINYDYPLLHYMLYEIPNAVRKVNSEDFNAIMYKKSQEIIDNKFSAIYNPKLYQLDLFRLHHYDNKARMTSLKHLQFAMHWENLQELPYDHYDPTIGSTQETLDNMLLYNENDVMSTYKFFELSKKELAIRKKLKVIFGLDFYSKPDATMGYEIFLDRLSKAEYIPLNTIKRLRTYRSTINVEKEVILPKLHEAFKYINIFKDVYDNFNSKIIKEDTSINYEFLHNNNGHPIKYVFGLGGIHASIESALVQSNSDSVIIDSDIVSFYPFLSIVYKFKPEHFSEEFNNAYLDLFNERKKYPKKTHFGENYAIKIALNSVYGKSNDEYSALYDKLMTYQITINGQLFICNFINTVLLNIKSAYVIQANTDGVTFYIERKDHNKYLEICKKFEKFSNLQLEHQLYTKMWIRDVNNYLAEYEYDGKLEYKNKGDFEIDKAYHKDQSMKIVTKAAVDYLTKNIPIKTTILNHNNIYDFFISQKVGKQFKVEYHYVENGKFIKLPMQRLNRFYVSKSGGGLVKVKDDGSIHRLVAGNSITIMNNVKLLFNMSNYNINYNFYIKESEKLVNSIINNQLKLI
jgi:hypothetical protein